MKTLDEVIKAYEICMNPGGEAEECIGCPYADETGEPLCCGEDKEDALHYLKEYKAKQEDLEQKNDHVCEMAKTICEQYDRLCNRLAEEYRNDALSMKYFSQLIDTEPIWCEELEKWYLFLAYDDGDNQIQLMTDKGNIETFDESDLEKYPLYRRK